MIGPERQLTPATHAVMETLRKCFPDQLADLDACHFRHIGIAGDDLYGLEVCGMFVGIEPDGYAHT